MSLLLLIIGMISCSPEPSNPTWVDFVHSIHQVESGGQMSPKDGDGGKAIGPLQIWWVYWKDAHDFDPSLGGSYQDCRDYDYSVKVMRVYFRRYAPEALGRNDWEVLARIHNGGPKGHEKSATLGYWRKVRQVLQDR